MKIFQYEQNGNEKAKLELISCLYNLLIYPWIIFLQHLLLNGNKF